MIQIHVHIQVINLVYQYVALDLHEGLRFLRYLLIQATFQVVFFNSYFVPLAVLMCAKKTT